MEAYFKYQVYSPYDPKSDDFGYRHFENGEQMKHYAYFAHGILYAHN